AGFVDHADRADRPVHRRWHQALREHALNFAVHVLRRPRRVGEEALQSQDLILADAVVVRLAKSQSYRLGTLAARSQEQAIEIDQRLRLRFFSPKERRETMMKTDQFARGSAQFVCRHGGLLPEPRRVLPNWPAR